MPMIVCSVPMARCALSPSAAVPSATPYPHQNAEPYLRLFHCDVPHAQCSGCYVCASTIRRARMVLLEGVRVQKGNSKPTQHRA
ncbi:hypothetical protein DICSQDRAFT_133971 [Dichomitus squalens LYAD-421 SS1]|uniref:Uncharacterized protein n=1 Tax=Dichomitus squalens TaxID=114155 RepID=A0A4Q9PYT7_9APHY|nr:uncharacterized protein DICSQDRAFT_133971 [Dichomitus squalens LYAD-421 SS1]EJF64301.1 hypothetical protein DICSQDRAFT_133971 [Dichomitus squalens LYAD-421 SS1]TBU59484.1 hypothetical protein BD310DRAFT_947914 [Dichomitus squalens]